MASHNVVHRSSGVYKLQALDRAFAVLDLLAASNTAMGLAEIAEALGLHKSTAHRFLMVLERHRMVERTQAGKFRLGLRLCEYGSRAIEQFDLRDRAQLHLKTLVAEVEETAHLCILEKTRMVYIDKQEPERSIRMTSRVGASSPVHCTAVGKAILASAGTQLISFTGATEVGRVISEACAHTVKKCHLEMGGKNIIIVMDDANLDLAVDGAIWGGFGTSGQRCTAASRVAVHKKVYGEFVAKFTERAKALRVGDGLDPATDMGPCVNEQQLKTVMSYVEIGKNEGAKLAAGGKRIEDGDLVRGWFHQPTVFTDCDPKMRICQEEIFGPVVSVIPFETFDDALEIANGVQYGLSAAIYTRNVNNAFRAQRDLQTGIVYVNAPTIGAETHLPFGGIKNTGNGHRESGEAALDFYSEWKTIYIDYSDRLQRAQIDNAE